MLNKVVTLSLLLLFTCCMNGPYALIQDITTDSQALESLAHLRTYYASQFKDAVLLNSYRKPLGKANCFKFKFSVGYGTENQIEYNSQIYQNKLKKYSILASNYAGLSQSEYRETMDLPFCIGAALKKIVKKRPDLEIKYMRLQKAQVNFPSFILQFQERDSLVTAVVSYDVLKDKVTIRNIGVQYKQDRQADSSAYGMGCKYHDRSGQCLRSSS